VNRPDPFRGKPKVARRLPARPPRTCPPDIPALAATLFEYALEEDEAAFATLESLMTSEIAAWQVKHEGDDFTQDDWLALTHELLHRAVRAERALRASATGGPRRP
jgi:hypothetical protein